MVKALPFIHQKKRVEEKGNDVLAADWLCQTHMKNYRIFSWVLVRLFSWLGILVEQRSLYDK